MKGTQTIVMTGLMLLAAEVGFAQSITYNFRPPQNNFYVKWKGPDGTVEFHGYINGGFWTQNVNGEGFSTSEGRYYYRDGNRWYLDDDYSSSEVREWISSHLEEPEMLALYYTRFWKQYNAAAGGNLRADLYHKGQERFLGINCNIFVDNMNRRYWIDPSNGCTLKMTDASGTVGYEVIEYNLNFTSWPTGLPPR